MTGRNRATMLTIVLALCAFTGCAKYVTPGAAAGLSGLADADVRELLERQPAASFPARLVSVRVQAPGYRSLTKQGYGGGRYTVITTRDVEQEPTSSASGVCPWWP